MAKRKELTAEDVTAILRKIDEAEIVPDMWEFCQAAEKQAPAFDLPEYGLSGLATLINAASSTLSALLTIHRLNDGRKENDRLRAELLKRGQS
jgi:hypothetical protein